MTRHRSDLLREITRRGYLHQCTDPEGLDTLAAAGPIAAYMDALRRELDIELQVGEFREHSLGDGDAARAAAYIGLRSTGGGAARAFWGVGIDGSIVTASLRALTSAVNRALA